MDKEQIRQLWKPWRKHNVGAPPNAGNVIDFAHFVVDEYQKNLVARERAETEAVRYALATFRALDQYTFKDSDHGLLIAEAVKKLEEAELSYNA